MRIPAIAPTNLAGRCTIMDVWYMLEFTVTPSGPAFDLKVSFPIVIGTIPLRQYMDTLVSPSPSAPLNPSLGDLPPAYSNLSRTSTSTPQIAQFK